MNATQKFVVYFRSGNRWVCVGGFEDSDKLSGFERWLYVNGIINSKKYSVRFAN